ncbi:hypothetical protein UNDYM_2125 [Undibacterium sp. YM2]|uniref:hypothetical protein n=1 Tax=Undibacterium sp. YM2 TaxID=2058625 RepID=UPI001331D7C6|nr:hypothetical protein [Undibacterium sp. YM2]BBB66378.1 hypothetical protein UNDYM_2125 [Undibacterium sp. YM2]
MTKIKTPVLSITAEIHELLSKDGFRPEIIENNLVKVMVEGGLFVIAHDEKDQGYFEITYQPFWKEEDQSKIFQLVESCNKANQQTKFAKLITQGNKVHCVVQCLHPNTLSFYNNFKRYVSAINFGVSAFTESMNKKTLH